MNKCLQEVTNFDSNVNYSIMNYENSTIFHNTACSKVHKCKCLDLDHHLQRSRKYVCSTKDFRFHLAKRRCYQSKSYTRGPLSLKWKARVRSPGETMMENGLKHQLKLIPCIPPCLCDRFGENM